jgi:hypothetical protein
LPLTNDVMFGLNVSAAGDNPKKEESDPPTASILINSIEPKAACDTSRFSRLPDGHGMRP